MGQTDRSRREIEDARIRMSEYADELFRRTSPEYVKAEVKAKLFEKKSEAQARLKGHAIDARDRLKGQALVAKDRVQHDHTTQLAIASFGTLGLMAITKAISNRKAVVGYERDVAVGSYPAVEPVAGVDAAGRVYTGEVRVPRTYYAVAEHPIRGKKGNAPAKLLLGGIALVALKALSQRPAGQQLQQRITGKLQDVKLQASSKLDQAKAQLSGKVEEVKAHASDAVHGAKDKLHSARGNLGDRVSGSQPEESVVIVEQPVVVVEKA